MPFHTVGDAKALHGANTTDILLTSIWPASVRNGSKIIITPPEGATDPGGYEHIANLCVALKPRYHFSSSDFFYEREPFFHSQTADTPDFRPLTRFISLAPHGNSSKQKALYAFSLQASIDQTAPLPVGTTASPLIPRRPKGTKRQALDPNPYPQRYKRGKGGRGERQPPPGPDQCFFCLSNPTLATHLISSIGDDAYLTIAKGPLTTSTTNAGLGMSVSIILLRGWIKVELSKSLNLSQLVILCFNSQLSLIVVFTDSGIYYRHRLPRACSHNTFNPFSNNRSDSR